jgi:hypothetical protein
VSAAAMLRAKVFQPGQTVAASPTVEWNIKKILDHSQLLI